MWENQSKSISMQQKLQSTPPKGVPGPPNDQKGENWPYASYFWKIDLKSLWELFFGSNGLIGHDCDEKCRWWCGVAHEGWQNGAKWPQWHGADKGMNMQRKKWKKIKWFWNWVWIPIPKRVEASTILPWGARGCGVAHKGWPNGAKWLISWSTLWNSSKKMLTMHIILKMT